MKVDVWMKGGEPFFARGEVLQNNGDILPLEMIEATTQHIGFPSNYVHLCPAGTNITEAVMVYLPFADRIEVVYLKEEVFLHSLPDCQLFVRRNEFSELLASGNDFILSKE